MSGLLQTYLGADWSFDSLWAASHSHGHEDPELLPLPATSRASHTSFFDHGA